MFSGEVFKYAHGSHAAIGVRDSYAADKEVFPCFFLGNIAKCGFHCIEAGLRRIFKCLVEGNRKV